MSKAEGKSGVHWGSRLGVVLAVAGSAVGLGNFLRFPGQAAQNGAGAFMVPYFIALLIVGIPLAWAEWSMGRYSGVRGFHSAPGIFAALCRNRYASFIGALALLIPLMVYTYYVVIEAWCLGYAFHYLTGNLTPEDGSPQYYSDFFVNFTGQGAKGDALNFGGTSVLFFVIFTFVLNFVLIMRGLNKGIETFCKFAMPVMIVCALCVLARVLTLGTPDIEPATKVAIYEKALSDDPDNPERYLWYAISLYGADRQDDAVNAAKSGVERIDDLPAYIAGLETQLDEATADSDEELASLKDGLQGRIDALKELDAAEVAKENEGLKTELAAIVAGEEPEQPNQSVAGGLNFMWNPDFGKLMDPSTWLAAAGQIFFSLSVGFGVIINYSSYLRRKDDIALSGLTASTTNEFFEVVLGGLITLPAAFIFLGLMAGTFGTFSLGFNALPNVFALMPGGRIFGFLWFFMLFLAAITSSLSMLQPVSAFFEEGLGLKRSGSVILLGILTVVGCSFVVYYSKNLGALDNIDFWCGTFLIVVLATLQSIIYGWVFGTQRGAKELDSGGLIKVPGVVQVMLKYVTPVFLLVILGATIVNQSGGYVKNFQEDPVARYSVMMIGLALLFLMVTIGIAIARWSREGKFDSLNDEK